MNHFKIVNDDLLSHSEPRNQAREQVLAREPGRLPEQALGPVPVPEQGREERRSRGHGFFHLLRGVFHGIRCGSNCLLSGSLASAAAFSALALSSSAALVADSLASSSLAAAASPAAWWRL
ncbi:hypothetical protein [Verrucomicrobium spinosum]|uniref:hypothetical protein n=1 Tax=Verrucomicrobium spinosum TaxID=2736 RepID=UPI001C46766B|nr:hypothetical protein [Verrucomicrobium spinosum]